MTKKCPTCKLNLDPEAELRLYSPDRIAEKLWPSSIQPQWLINRARDGSIPFTRVRRSIMFSAAQIEQILKLLAVEPKPDTPQPTVEVPAIDIPSLTPRSRQRLERQAAGQ